jgi:epoxyqueuosine reductase
MVEDEMMVKIGNRLYGCDTCQIVCPINRKIDFRHHEELLPDPELAKPLLRPLLKMSNREFSEKFGAGSASWRGRKPIQRNALIALGNFKDAESVPDIVAVMNEDPRAVLRATAAWALGRIGSFDAIEGLKNRLPCEEDVDVRTAIEKALSVQTGQSSISEEIQRN